MAETFNSATVKLTTTNPTDVYQAPIGNAADRAIVLSCLVANVNGVNNASITLAIVDASNNVLATIANTITVPADSTLEAIPNKLILKSQQKIRATASAANHLDIILSALEITA